MISDHEVPGAALLAGFMEGLRGRGPTAMSARGARRFGDRRRRDAVESRIGYGRSARLSCEASDSSPAKPSDATRVRHATYSGFG